MFLVQDKCHGSSHLSATHAKAGPLLMGGLPWSIARLPLSHGLARLPRSWCWELRPCCRSVARTHGCGRQFGRAPLLGRQLQR